jgi:hypothetical protein
VNNPIKPDREPTWIELESVRPLSEARERTSLSEDTLKREYPDYVIQLSPRRLGMKLRHILGITRGELRPTS